ncbi:MAG: ornithine carbamoyltransferase [Verrucomicrobia bacterium]|nr:ornithine carbamoyltransferase [Verrucomicrobiota bacterium]
MSRVTKNPIASLQGRSLLTPHDLSDREFLGLLKLAAQLKRKKERGTLGTLLRGKQLALIFEKLSTRTRCAASVATADEGGRAEYLSAREIHLGKKESTADTARVLGRMFDGILYRGYRQETVELLAQHSGVPVWNGLTDTEHPTQALADIFTVQEAFGRMRGLKLVYVGDGRNNVASSLMVGCAMAGINFVNCIPPELAPTPESLARASVIARRNRCTIDVVHAPALAVRGAHVVYTDVWVSMGEEAQEDARIQLLRPYQVNMALMRHTGNLQNGKVMFLHCLPAFHNHATETTAVSGALEVTDEVFEASFSKVFDLAENRMHTMKAIFVASLTGGGRKPRRRT